MSRYRAEIDRGLGDSILGVMLQGIDPHLGHPWEEAVRAHVRRECAAGRLASDVVAVGSWWGGHGHDEIDVLALAGRSRTPVLAGEVKWARSVDAPHLVHELHRKVERGLRADVEALRYLVAARDTAREASNDTVVVTAGDVFRPS